MEEQNPAYPSTSVPIPQGLFRGIDLLHWRSHDGLWDNRDMRGPVRIIKFPAPPGVEADVHDLILRAIHEKRLLRFSYKNNQRIVEPHDYGIQNNVVNLFTYQTGGQSSSGPLPQWRKFAVQGISRIELLDEAFPGSRAVPSQSHQEWDVLFARVDY